MINLDDLDLRTLQVEAARALSTFEAKPGGQTIPEGQFSYEEAQEASGQTTEPAVHLGGRAQRSSESAHFLSGQTI